MVVVLVVGGILLAIAAPNMRDAIRSYQLTSQANEVVGALNLARSEAVNRSQRVTMCRSANGVACANGADWEAGWLVFVDADADAVVDAGEQVIRVYPPMGGGATLRTAAKYQNWIGFLPNGASVGANANSNPVDLNLRLCPTTQDASRAYGIEVGLIGRISSRKNITTIGGGLACP